MWVALTFHLYQSFLLYVMVKNKKEKMIENWRWHLGETNSKPLLLSGIVVCPLTVKRTTSGTL